MSGLSPLTLENKRSKVVITPKPDTGTGDTTRIEAVFDNDPDKKAGENVPVVRVYMLAGIGPNKNTYSGAVQLHVKNPDAGAVKDLRTYDPANKGKLGYDLIFSQQEDVQHLARTRNLSVKEATAGYLGQHLDSKELKPNIAQKIDALTGQGIIRADVATAVKETIRAIEETSHTMRHEDGPDQFASRLRPRLERVVASLGGQSAARGA